MLVFSVKSPISNISPIRKFLAGNNQASFGRGVGLSQSLSGEVPSYLSHSKIGFLIDSLGNRG
jgi:hypothetical protein